VHINSKVLIESPPFHLGRWRNLCSPRFRFRRYFCWGGVAEENGFTRICSEGALYVERILTGLPRKAINACEGGCIKGEVARVAANILAYQLERDTAVRICLGYVIIGI